MARMPVTLPLPIAERDRPRRVCFPVLLGSPAVRYLAAGALYPSRTEGKKSEGRFTLHVHGCGGSGRLVVQDQEIPTPNLAAAKADVMFALHIQFDE